MLMEVFIIHFYNKEVHKATKFHVNARFRFSKYSPEIIRSYKILLHAVNSPNLSSADYYLFKHFKIFKKKSFQTMTLQLKYFKCLSL